MFELLAYPFMQRALIAGALLGLLFACLGVIATLRKMAFFGEGIAHASLAGIAIGVLTGFAPLPLAILWGALTAALIYILERSTKLSSDTLIGILFTASMALGVILIAQTEGYQPELLSFLFGNILTIQTSDLYTIAALSLVILIWFFTSLKQITLSSLSEETAIIAGIPVRLQTFILYIALAVATVLGVKILGIILVSALIVLPPAISRLYATSFRSYLWLSVVLAEIIILSGLILSFKLDLPSGAVIVLVGSFLFLLSALLTTRAN